MSIIFPKKFPNSSILKAIAFPSTVPLNPKHPSSKRKDSEVNVLKKLLGLSLNEEVSLIEKVSKRLSKGNTKALEAVKR